MIRGSEFGAEATLSIGKGKLKVAPGSIRIVLHNPLLDIPGEGAGCRTLETLQGGSAPVTTKVRIIIETSAQPAFHFEQTAEKTLIRALPSRTFSTDAFRSREDILPAGSFHQRSPSQSRMIHGNFV